MGVDHLAAFLLVPQRGPVRRARVAVGLIGSLRPEFFVTRGQAISLSTLAWIRAISSSKNSPR
jgi:hypothetical protein